MQKIQAFSNKLQYFAYETSSTNLRKVFSKKTSIADRKVDPQSN